MSSNLQHVTSASITVLKEMKIKIDAVDRYEEGARILAETKNLSIQISLDPISDNTTKVSINVSKFAVLKDKATASAIISQINTFLSHDKLAAAQPKGRRVGGEDTGAQANFNLAHAKYRYIEFRIAEKVFVSV